MINNRVGKKVLILLAAALLCAPSFAASPLPADGRGASRTHADGPSRLARGNNTPTRQVRHSGGHHGGRHYGHSGYRYGRGYGFGGYYGSYYRGYGYYGFPYGVGIFGMPYFYYNNNAYSTPNTAPVDLNVKPKNAKVYVNGQLVGKARRFDGFPDYLWLPEGNHEIILYMEGYETVVKDVEITAGVRLKADLKMVAGKATPVEELSQARQKQSDERERLYKTYSKSRVMAGNSVKAQPHTPHQPHSPAGAEAPASDSATVYLTVSPLDAVLYMDGRFLGKADELTSRGGSLTVADGPHEIVAVRPGFNSQKTTFDAIAGKKLNLAISLEQTEEE